MLLKRYKNRLKDLDLALHKFDQKKADVTALEALADATHKGRALEVFNDMKLLFDTTLENLRKKQEIERNQTEKIYDRIYQQQRKEIKGFEKRYNLFVKQKLTQFEHNLSTLALEQARLTEGSILSDDRLFPDKLEGSIETQVEALKIKVESMNKMQQETSL